MATDRRSLSPHIQASLLVRAASQALVRQAEELRRAGASIRADSRGAIARANGLRARLSMSTAEPDGLALA